MKAFVTINLYGIIGLLLGFPCTNGNDLDEEEETFVRSVVARMVKEDGGVFKPILDTLAKATNRLDKMETALAARCQETQPYVPLPGQQAAIETTKNLTTGHYNELRDIHFLLATLIEGQNNLSARIESIEEAKGGNKLNLTSEPVPSIDVTPFDCGGVIEGTSIEVLEFQAPTILPYASTCVWTVRLPLDKHTTITLALENFIVSKSKLRLMSMWGMSFKQYNGSSSSLDQLEWAGGSQGATVTLQTYAVFVELIIQPNSSIPPKFILSFLKADRRSSWAELTLGHSHMTNQNGTVNHRNEKLYSSWSFVILPKPSISKNVTLAKEIINLRNCSHCKCDRLRIWKLGSQSLLGTSDNSFRFCRMDTSFNYASDDIGFIIVYDSTTEPKGNFAFHYHASG